MKDFAGRCPVCLASYPRSGNHAVRSLIEMAFGRPTLGAGDSEQWRFPRWLVDKPIGLRLDPPIAYVSRSPVAVKRHEFLEVDHWDYLIETIRDPRDAITSHTKNLAFETFEEKASKEVELWLQHIERFEEWDINKRLSIRYSDVLKKPERVLCQLENFLRLSRIHSVDHREVAVTGLSALVRTSANHIRSPSFQFPERARVVEEKLNMVRTLESLERYF